MEDLQRAVMGINHIKKELENPMTSLTPQKTEKEMMENISYHFGKIMEELGLDLTDDSLSGTPNRVAKMYVKELFYGLNPKNRPSISTFENKYQFGKLVVEQEIKINSACEHHFLPIVGVAHVGYIPNKKVIGLSKINRLVDYYAHRPQVQERLNKQILSDLQRSLDTKDVIVMIRAKHLCVSSRGIKDEASFTTTLEFDGAFSALETRKEFLSIIQTGYGNN